MALNPAVSFNIAKYLFTNSAGYVGQEQTFRLNTQASEIVLNPDNINQNLSRYPCLSQQWNCAFFNDDYSQDYGDFGVGGFGYYNYDNGYRWPWTYYTSGGSDVDETGHYGYLSSFFGAFSNSGNNFMFNTNGSAAEIAEVYGHGVPPTEVALDVNFQYRNSASLPQDGSAVITTTGSNYNRSPYTFPCFYAVNVVQGGPLSSGSVSVVVEKLPTFQTIINNYVDTMNSDYFGLDQVWYNGVLNRRQLEYMLGSWMWSCGNMTYSHQTPSGTGAVPGLIWNDENPAVTNPIINRYLGARRKDPRNRDRATYQLNGEYFCVVNATFILIFSSKSTMIPVQAFNLETSFTGTNKRIAGLTTIGMQIYAISEDGEMVLIDFSTVSGGTVTVLPAAANCPVGHRYAGLTYAQDTNTLWAMRGLYALHSWELTTAGNPGVALIPFNPSTQTWGAVADSGISNIRVGGRDLNQLSYVNGNLCVLGDVVTSMTNNIPLLTWLSANDVVNTYWSNTSFKVPIRGYQVRNLSGIPAGQAWVRFKPDTNQTTSAGMNGITFSNVTLFQTPTGSPAGTPYTANEQLKWGGLTSVGAGNTFFDSDPLQTLAISPTNDYYLYLMTTGSGNCNYKAHPGVGNVSGTNFAATAVEDVINNNNDSGPFDNLYYNSATPVWIQQTQNGQQDNNEWVYQLAVYNVNGASWATATHANLYNNSSAYQLPLLQNGTITSLVDGYGSTGAWEDLGPSNFNTNSTLNWNRCFPWGNTLLVQIGPYRDQIFTFSNGTLTPYTQLSVSNPMTTAASFGPAVFIENQIDGSLILYENGYSNMGYGTVWAGNTWVFDPGFVWGTSVPYKVPYQLTASRQLGNGICSSTSAFSNNPTGYNHPLMEAVFPVMFTDQTLVCQQVCANGYDVGYPALTALNFCNIPRYYYWDSTHAVWAVTSNWTLAAANPFVVPATAGTNIPLIDGLNIQFGPANGSTFSTGEFHTINVTYGNVKYTRRARYIQAAFAGKTFQTTETHQISDFTALTPVYVQPTSTSVNNILNPVYGAHGLVTWPKQITGVWNPDVTTGAYPQVNWAFSTPVNFCDIRWDSYYARGLTFEVSSNNGATFTQIIPLWRGHLGYCYTFNRQVGITNLRVTCKVPHNYDANNFSFGGVYLFDFGTQAQLNQARLGSSAASDGTLTKGSWDSLCMGVAHTAIISVDGGSPLLNQCYVGTDPLDDFYNMCMGNATVPAGRFYMHPFYGFLMLPGSTGNTPGTLAGTNVKITYFWGRQS